MTLVGEWDRLKCTKYLVSIIWAESPLNMLVSVASKPGANVLECTAGGSDPMPLHACKTQICIYFTWTLLIPGKLVLSSPSAFCEISKNWLFLSSSSLSQILLHRILHTEDTIHRWLLCSLSSLPKMEM